MGESSAHATGGVAVGNRLWASRLLRLYIKDDFEPAEDHALAVEGHLFRIHLGEDGVIHDLLHNRIAVFAVLVDDVREDHDFALKGKRKYS